MPSAFAHAAVGAALAAHVKPGRARFWIAAVLALAAAAPDLDVIGLWLGVPYEHVLGHRGASHSLFFAAAVGLASWPLWRWAGVERARTAAARVFFAVASHALLDAFTDAGLGVGLLIPFDDARLFAPVRPLPTSPLSVGAFFSDTGASILRGELVFVGPLVLLIALGPSAARRLRRRVPTSRACDGSAPSDVP